MRKMTAYQKSCSAPACTPAFRTDAGAGRAASPGFGVAVAGLASAALDLLIGWQQRYVERQELAMLDDRQLKDLGLTRGDIAAEADKPFWRA
jgi:uncharacterized protein YjiS (DUF1127 family)